MRVLQAGGRLGGQVVMLAFTVPGAVITYLTSRKVAPEWTAKQLEDGAQFLADAGKDAGWTLSKPFLKQWLPVFIVILFAVAAWKMLPAMLTTTNATNKVATNKTDIVKVTANKTGIVKVTTWVSFVGVVLGVMLRLSEVTEFAKTMTLPKFPSITVNPLYVWYAGYIAVALCVACIILKCYADCKDARYEEHLDAVCYNKKQRFELYLRKKYPERYD